MKDTINASGPDSSRERVRRFQVGLVSLELVELLFDARWGVALDRGGHDVSFFQWVCGNSPIEVEHTSARDRNVGTHTDIPRPVGLLPANPRVRQLAPAVANARWSMTWVFGSPTWLGTSVCLADIQVSVGDQTFDCLRKVYGLDQNVMAGFAGNVKTGFAMLGTLQRVIDDTKGSPDDPADVQAIFDRYPAAAAELFANLGDDGLKGGSAILVAAAEPADNTLYGSLARAARFVCPDFAVQEIAHRAWAAIGSGSDIPAYQAELEKVTVDEARSLVTLEANNPGGHAQAMAFFVTQAVGDMPPVRGISKHFHVGAVFAHGWELRTTDRTHFRGERPEEIRMPPVAQSWAELESLLAPHLTGASTVAIAA